MPRLNPTKVAAAIKSGLSQKIPDGNSLYLKTRNGRGYWIYQFREGHSFRSRCLGTAGTAAGYDHRLDLSPSAARHKREAKAVERRNDGLLRRGLANRIAHREPALAARTVHAGESETFGKVVEMFLALRAPEWRGGLEGSEAKSYRKLTHTRLAVLSADIITTADVEKALAEWSNRPATAAKVRMRIAKVLNFAKAKGYRTGENPASKEVFQHLLPEAPKAISYAKMKADDVPSLMKELIGRGTMDARALAFTILTVARSGETIGATWSEIDFKNAVWEIPATRMKEGRKHRVALSPQAVRVLGEPGAPKDYIFQNSKGGAIWVSAMLELLKTIKPNVTVHGFRACFSGDWALKNKYPSELREMALAHAIGDATKLAYNRPDDELVELLRPMMKKWSAFACGSKA